MQIRVIINSKDDCYLCIQFYFKFVDAQALCKFEPISQGPKFSNDISCKAHFTTETFYPKTPMIANDTSSTSGPGVSLGCPIRIEFKVTLIRRQERENNSLLGFW